MATIDVQSVHAVTEFASFASTEIIMFVMAAIVYGLFAHGPAIASKKAKSAKVSSPPTSGQAPGSVKSGAAASAPWRKPAGALPRSGTNSGAEISQPVAEIKALARKGDLDGAAAVLLQLRQGEAAPSAVVHNCFLDACVHCGDMKRTLAQFAEMKQLDIVDVVTYNTVLKAHLRRNQIAEAQDLLREMAARGLQASKVTYHELLNAMVSAKDRRGTWRLVDEMRKTGIPVSSITLSILLKALTERSCPDDVKRTMDLLEMLEEPVDEALFSSVIEACTRIRQLGFLSNLIRRYRARKDFTALTSPMYGAMIKAFGQVGDTAQVHELWCDMEERSVVPTQITVGCMVEALVVNGKAQEAWDLVHKLQEDSEQGCTNTVIYSTVLKGFAITKNIEKVFAVYKEMQKYDVQCNTITYNTLLDACAKSCAMDRAPALLEDMQRVQAEPDVITYATLVKGYCLEGKIDKAFQVLAQMKSDGRLKPDEIMYNSLLDGCAKKQRIEDALAILEEMQSAGVLPSNYTLSILVKLLGRARRLSQAFKVVEDLSTRYGLQLNVQVYTCLMQACFMNRKLDRALEVHDTMIAAGCMPDEKLYVALARGCLQLHAPQKAVDVVRAAFRLPGGALSMSGPAGRTAGIDAHTLDEVCKALQASSSEDRAAGAALVAQLEELRGVRVGGHASPSRGGAAPWHRGDRQR